jgi:hypothetical protein
VNLFNSYQALAIYTATPFAIQWLASNGNPVWAVVLGIGELIGFVLLGIAINETTK